MTVATQTRSRTVSWQDPAILRAAAAELDGRAFLQAIQEGRLPRMVDGGLLCTVLDSDAGCAVQTPLPVATEYSSLEIKVRARHPR